MSGSVFICPICGEENKPNAEVCVACGADERTGFREDYYETQFAQDGLDLPDEELENETERRSSNWIQIAIAIGLVALLVAYLVL